MTFHHFLAVPSRSESATSGVENQLGSLAASGVSPALSYFSMQIYVPTSASWPSSRRLDRDPRPRGYCSKSRLGYCWLVELSLES